MTTKYPRGKLVKLLNQEWDVIWEECSHHSYLRLTAKHNILKGIDRGDVSKETAKLYCLNKLLDNSHPYLFDGSKPSDIVPQPPIKFSYYGKTYTYPNEKETEMSDPKQAILDKVATLLEAVGETSYGGGDPKAMEALETKFKGRLKDLESKAKTLKEEAVKVTAKFNDAVKNEKSMREKLKEVTTTVAVDLEPVESDGTIPSGSIVMTPVSEVFTNIKWSKDFEVPVWSWDGVHPLVPSVDTEYVFREDDLRGVLRCLLSNERGYLKGHTGSGKTTLLEQVAAHLNYPFAIVNFDSEMSRMDLVGRDTLTVDPTSGETVSTFVEGIIPRAMSTPCILCCDEIDFVRPDVAYVMQRIFEGNAFTLAEDGGRVVHPDPNFRIFATGNTVGQGDEAGMYQGARPQSVAMLDRFTVWLDIEYLTPDQRLSLIKDKVPAIDSGVLTTLNKYITEHQKAFTEGQIIQPLSPRGYLSVAKATVSMESMSKHKPKTLLKHALKEAVLSRANNSDHMTLTEIVQRVCG